jgi:hypothetical protein
MKWFTRRRQDKRALPTGVEGRLTEFVYLDETSVTSLISSLKGPLIETQTESRTEELLAEIGATQGFNIPGLYQASASGKVGGQLGTSKSVQRRANIQTAFSELELALSEQYPLRNASVPPAWREGPHEVLERAISERLAVRASDLYRGRPIALDVELGIDESYAILALVETFNEFAKEPDLLGRPAVEAYQPAQAVGRVLRMMMAGLVPVECRLPSTTVVEWEGVEYVMAESLARLMGPNAKKSSLKLVAICEEASFWKDIRRVAFERGRYRVTARVARGGLQTAWSPIKMSDVVREFSPEVAGQLSNLPSMMAEALRAGGSSGTSVSSGNEKILRFAEKLAEIRGRSLEGELLAHVLRLGVGPARFDSPDQWRPVLNEVSELLEFEWKVQYSPDELLDARRFLLQEPAAHHEPVATTPVPQSDRFIEVDVIAIHW